MHSEQENKTPFLHTILNAAVVLLLIVLSLIYCNYQQVFTVKRIIVHGHRELSEKQVTRTSGIKRGAKMFDLDLSEGIRRLINEPYIHNASISRQFPDVIRIDIIERQPIVLINLREQYALDAFATILPLPESYPLESMPVITGVDPDLAFEIGKATWHPDIRHAIRFVNYVRQFSEEVVSYCNHITWSEDKGWIIQKSREYPPVYLGKDNLEKNMDILHAFITKMQDDAIDMRRYKYVSLRFNGQVIVRD